MPARLAARLSITQCADQAGRADRGREGAWRISISANDYRDHPGARALAALYQGRHLELYLNEIYHGNLAYGIEAASNVYFNKHANQLTLAEASLLAGLPAC
ncbi:MAG: transglycosylase domain-containing protein [Kouleothrix sp.]